MSHPPTINDTIVAVATAWQPSPLGIIRLSGPAALALVAPLIQQRSPHRASRVACSPWRADHAGVCRVMLELDGLGGFPADLLVFAAPRSYTGQDVVEIHTIGALPLLREICDRLIAAGARRANPGEFTARAFLAGKLDASQVEGVLGLLRCQDSASARAASRSLRGETAQLRDDVIQRLSSLLSAVEAEIDFVEEEDVRFISAAALKESLASIRASLWELRSNETRGAARAIPHVALVGRPNAGKSTLFNALVGNERAIVSPIVGTTRDVLTVDVDFAGVRVALQDTAGLGDERDELSLAAHLAAERAAAFADCVIWVHAAEAAWSEDEVAAINGLASAQRVLCVSKIDRAVARRPDTLKDLPMVEVCALRGAGLDALRRTVGDALAAVDFGFHGIEVGGALRALARIDERLFAVPGSAVEPELTAADLREALTELGVGAHYQVTDAVLARIFSQFCVGK